MSATHLRRRGQGGFTLIELMVVVLIIGILLAIAIPTFLGARSRSQDAVAKTALKDTVKTVLSALAGGAADNDEFDSPVDLLNRENGSLDYVLDKPSTGPKEISLHFEEGWGGFAARSASGTCWYVYGEGDDTGRITILYGQQRTDPCTGADAQSVADRKDW